MSNADKRVELEAQIAEAEKIVDERQTLVIEAEERVRSAQDALDECQNQG